MKKAIKTILSHILLLLSKKFGPSGIPILQYHRISNDIKPEDVHSITPKEFYSQIRYLISHEYKIINLHDLVYLLLNGYNKRERFVALTFDDGHKDNITYAYPILKEFNVCATMFVVTDYVGKAGWLDKFGELNITKSNNSQWWDLLTWDELIDISDHFLIESHGKSHKHLTALPYNELNKELMDPILKLKEKLNMQTSVYCYPYGEYSDETIKLVKSIGYIAACSSKKGINKPYKSDFWQLKRNEIGRDISNTHFQLQLTDGAYIYHNISTTFNELKCSLNKIIHPSENNLTRDKST